MRRRNQDALKPLQSTTTMTSCCSPGDASFCKKVDSSGNCPSGQKAVSGTCPSACSPQGACTVGARCAPMTSSMCQAGGGTYAGDNKACSIAGGLGACTMGDNSCSYMSASACAAAPGSFSRGDCCSGDSLCVKSAARSKLFMLLAIVVGVFLLVLLFLSMRRRR